MSIRQNLTGKTGRLIVGAIVVVLLFAFVYPFTGGFIYKDPETVGVHYDSTLLFSSVNAFLEIYLRSFEISVKSFTLVGASNYTVLGAGRFLIGMESFLGMVFIALLSSTLSRR